MANLIELDKIGTPILKYFENRIIRNNKNIIGTILGATGSSKSYTSLRIAELWYKYHFKKEFPIENVCFSIEEIISLLNKKTLKRGEVIIFEEAGVSMGALDFQTKISKVFTYVLQSFRNLNLCLILNLPYASMLNKNVRLLTHFTFETAGIDYQKKISRVKPFFVQINTRSGKIYPKFLRVKYNGRTITLKKFSFSIPSPNLIESYEEKKLNFVNGLISGFNKTLEQANKPAEPTEVRPLTEFQSKVKELYEQLGTQAEVARKLGKTQGLISNTCKLIRKKGGIIERKKQ